MIEVPESVLRGLQTIQQLRECDMLSYRSVAAKAASYGYFETSRWIVNNPGKYEMGLLKGFTVEIALRNS